MVRLAASFASVLKAGKRDDFHAVLAGVILPDDNTAAPAADKTTAIMALMRSDPEITLKHLSEKLGMKLSTVKYYVKKLSDAQEIRRSGNRQRGRWKVMIEKNREH